MAAKTGNNCISGTLTERRNSNAKFGMFDDVELAKGLAK